MAITTDADIQADPAILAEIVRGIRAVGNPQKIVLFGSRARGNAGPDSDYDIFVIEDSDEPRWTRSVKYYGALSCLPVAKDVVVWTPAEVEEWSTARSCLATIALREGRLLYED